MPPAALPKDTDGFAGTNPPAATSALRFGRYEVLEPIARGSMGTVYKARDPTTSRPVALKVMRHDRLDADLRQRLRTEAEVGRRLQHPHVVAAHECGDAGEFVYLVMEYVPGVSLRHRLSRRIDLRQTLTIMAQLLDALEHAHHCGVWHRDVKPSNILLSDAGAAKLADFGIAALRSSTLPQADAIMGTPGFIAPETYLTDAFDGRADVFAAGAVLYRMLTGVAPFNGSADRIMFEVCRQTPAAPSVAACSAHLRPLDAVVLKALAIRPEDRFATPADLAYALGPFGDRQRRRPGG